MVLENSRVTVPKNSDAIGVTFTIIPVLAYVLLPTTIHIIFLGILKTSIVVPRAKELGGMIIYSELFLVTKLSEENSFALGTTIEVFKIPRDIMCIVVGKSTYARTGIIVNVTPIESEFFGTVTLEFSNTTPLPAKIYANEGVAQFLFLKGDQAPEISYADRKGKYMGQTGVTLPKV